MCPAVATKRRVALPLAMLGPSGPRARACPRELSFLRARARGAMGLRITGRVGARDGRPAGRACPAGRPSAAPGEWGGWRGGPAWGSEATHARDGTRRITDAPRWRCSCASRGALRLRDALDLSGSLQLRQRCGCWVSAPPIAEWPNCASELERRIELARQRLAARACLAVRVPGICRVPIWFACRRVLLCAA